MSWISQAVDKRSGRRDPGWPGDSGSGTGGGRVPPPGPHEIRFRIEAAGISFADLPMCQGLHPERYNPEHPRAPFVLRWDVVAIVGFVDFQILGVRLGHV